MPTHRFARSTTAVEAVEARERVRHSLERQCEGDDAATVGRSRELLRVDAGRLGVRVAAGHLHRMLGQAATLGRYKGIADVMGLRLRGFPGWFVTRSYHLYQLPLLSRK